MISFQPRSPVTFRSQSSQEGMANWTIALEPAVHVPSGPFQPPPEHVLERPFGESPVRYREGPLEYEPARYFPGRRFYSCMVGSNGCGLSEWYDPPFSQFVTNMVGDLRDSVLELRERVQALKKEVDEYNEQKQELQGSLEDMVKNLSMK
uniref:Uncharacterized protein n=1 Tax=Setaria italica TaxID=4555 RepID=K3YE75_SETIT